MGRAARPAIERKVKVGEGGGGDGEDSIGREFFLNFPNLPYSYYIRNIEIFPLNT